MSYHDGPTHGKPSSAPPAKRSRQVAVKLTGGPRDGDVVTYGQPLPPNLVVFAKDAGKWVDYYRKPNSTEYLAGKEFWQEYGGTTPESRKQAQAEIDQHWAGD